MLENDNTCINFAISAVTGAILDRSAKTLPTVKFMSFPKPYWGDELSDSHKKITVLRNVSYCNGRPRNTDYMKYKDYKEAKRAFRKLHRLVVNAYLSKQDSELDKIAEVDGNRFWKIVYSKKKGSRSRTGAGIKFNNVVSNKMNDVFSNVSQPLDAIVLPDDKFNMLECPTRWLPRASRMYNGFLCVA